MHIRPWEIDLMTYEQFELACHGIDLYAKQTSRTTTQEEGDDDELG